MNVYSYFPPPKQETVQVYINEYEKLGYIYTVENPQLQEQNTD